MLLVPVPPASINEAWPVLEPFAQMRAAAFPDDWPIEETIRKASTGLLMLWLVIDDDKDIRGVVGTVVLDKPSGRRVLTVEWAAGHDPAEYTRDAMTALEAHARANDCDAIEVRGRDGWSRFLPDYTVLGRAVVLMKELR